MNKTHILFVEPQGDLLHRQVPALSAHASNWHLVRAVDPQAALAILHQYPVGVVVGSFGVAQAACEAFFRQAKGVDPASFRIALIPEELRSQFLEPGSHINQCLVAGAPSDHLILGIRRGLGVWRRAQSNPRLPAFLADIEDLPTPPAIYFEINDELESPVGNLHSIAAIVNKDPALTAKVLKVANSGFFSFPRQIVDMYEAIGLLGVEMLQALVLSTRLFSALPIPGLSLDRLWRHWVTVGALAREIAQKKSRDRTLANASGVAGLLHDAGQLILMSKAPDIYFSAIRQADGDEGLLLERERAELGVGHPEVGAYLLALWGLPGSVSDAVECHHDWMPSNTDDAPLPLQSVYGAEWLVTNLRSNAGVPGNGAGVPNTDSEKPGQLVAWREELMRFFDTEHIQKLGDDTSGLALAHGSGLQCKDSWIPR